MTEPTAKIVGPAIRRVRESKGVPQSCLANCLGVCQQTVSRWEAGLFHVKAEHVLTIARKLGVPVGVLYGEE